MKFITLTKGIVLLFHFHLYPCLYVYTLYYLFVWYILWPAILRVLFLWVKRTSWPWSYGSWVYNYLCNQCLSPMMLWVRISIRARCTTLCDKVCQWPATGRWFSPGTSVSSTNKSNLHDIIAILLKVALNTIKQTNKQTIHVYYDQQDICIQRVLFLWGIYMKCHLHEWKRKKVYIYDIN